MWPTCARVLLVTRAWLVPETGQGRFVLPLNHPQPSILDVRMKCLIRYYCLEWAYQVPRGKYGWNLVFSESQKYLSYLKRKSKLRKKTANGVSVGFYVAISILLYYLLQGVSRHISLSLPSYFLKCCVSKNHSSSGACTMSALGMMVMVGSPTITQRTR